jgi:hypothetical protein
VFKIRGFEGGIGVSKCGEPLNSTEAASPKHWWIEKGSKYVLVHRMEDKRQISCSVSSTVEGNLLSFQLIFQVVSIDVYFLEMRGAK